MYTYTLVKFRISIEKNQFTNLFSIHHVKNETKWIHFQPKHETNLLFSPSIFITSFKKYAYGLINIKIFIN